MLLRIIVLVLLVLTPAIAGADTARYQQWLQEMREQPRGPFSRVRWFCNDGTVLPPKAYACQPHGGGFQHGEWNARTLELRENGYLVANFLAGIKGSEWLAQPGFENAYGQLLIERFLVAADDGWILRRALLYRGAIQEEDERAGARELLLALLSDKDFLEAHYLSLYSGIKLLPHTENTASAGRVRQLSAALSDSDPGFMPVRIKIHGAPDATDADRVREYMQGVEDPGLQQRFAVLVQEIDSVYAAAPLSAELLQLADNNWLPQSLGSSVRTVAAEWEQAGATDRMDFSGQLLAELRAQLRQVSAPDHRLQLLDFALRLETEHFIAATAVREKLGAMSRTQILRALAAAGDAAYGTGLLNARLHQSLKAEIQGLLVGDIDLARYERSIAYLNRVPGWGQQALRRYFYPSMLTLAEIEPLALLFIQDQLRGSPLMFYSLSLNTLVRDVGDLAGVRHRVFGEVVGAGFNALNPGLARGTLRAKPLLDGVESLRSDGIYILPETISELLPVAGILTAGAGNPLSHVQLLARNLGIPNVTVSPALQGQLTQHDGAAIVLAVSPGGLVEISEDGPDWDAVFNSKDKAGAVRIVPDLEKLDLLQRQVVSIDNLSAADSGRSVGPKAAKLAELRKHYPDAVSRGVAIPFGVFKEVALQQSHPDGGTVFDWMRAQYKHLETLPEGGAERERQTEAFRAELYQLILDTKLTPAFKADLRQSLQQALGGEDVGLFVRSDTNVEDLAGFTGAGLNLTLPNVVGIEQLFAAIPRVWASPFTARAFSWRQSHMAAPEHVYTSILLLESVGSDKSGVLITADIGTGATDVISVAVNEGLGGAVDGQAAESLRIPLSGDPVRVLATATAPTRRILSATGGVIEVPSSGTDRVLSEAEIGQLITFVRSLPERFPPITDDTGNPAPADVEFGFLDGKLRLFQLRPFLDSASVASSRFLRQMDARADRPRDQKVDMEGSPL